MFLGGACLEGLSQLCSTDWPYLSVAPLGPGLCRPRRRGRASERSKRAESIGPGLSFQAVGPSFDAWFSALRERTRGIPGDGLAPSRVEGYFLPRLFGEIGTALMLDDLLALCEELEPGLIVFDPYLFAAPLVAALTGTPAVLHTIGPLMEPSILEFVADAVSPIWREFKMDVPLDAGLYGGTTLTICPASLKSATVGIKRAQPLRPVPLPTASASLPAWFPEALEPLIYVTLERSNNDLALFGLVLEAFEDEPVKVLVTIGRDNDPSVLSVPDNAHVERYVPQSQVLPHCSAVVHHAGAGTMFGVLAARASFPCPAPERRQFQELQLARAGWSSRGPDARGRKRVHSGGRPSTSAGTRQLPNKCTSARRGDLLDALAG